MPRTTGSSSNRVLELEAVRLFRRKTHHLLDLLKSSDFDKITCIGNNIQLKSSTKMEESKVECLFEEEANLFTLSAYFTRSLGQLSSREVEINATR